MNKQDLMKKNKDIEMTQKYFDNILLVLTIVSSILIILTKFFPFSFNPFKFSDSNIISINEIIFNLSLSFLASYIFYLINIQIISSFRKKRSRLLIDSYLSDIATKMKIGQLYWEKRVFRDKLNDRTFDILEEHDFKEIKSLNENVHTFSYKFKDYYDNWCVLEYKIDSERQYFDEERRDVQMNIQRIFSFPFATTLDFELISILQKINISLFYYSVEKFSSSLTVDVNIPNFEKYCFQHYKNYQELLRFIEPREVEQIVDKHYGY